MKNENAIASSMDDYQQELQRAALRGLIALPGSPDA
jgi:hypothetical protein